MIPYSGCCRSFFAISWPTSPAPTITAFCTYMALRRASERARARPSVMNAIAAAQKISSFGVVGCARPVTYAPTQNRNVHTVTMWNTPAKSSAVEWSVRSSSAA